MRALSDRWEPHIKPQIVTIHMQDGYPLQCRYWDGGNGGPAIVLLHGIISHSGWYVATGNRLAAAGYRVYAVDRRGSGLNLQDRGDVTTADQWIEDVLSVLDVCGGAGGSTLAGVSQRPLLAGISWGGVLAAAVAQQAPQRLQAVAFICPGFYSRRGTSRLQHRLVAAANRIGLGDWMAPVPLRDPALFTNDPRWQAYIANDPFTLRRVTLRLADGSGQLYQRVTQQSCSIDVPAALMLAEGDAIIDNQRVLQHCQRTARQSLSMFRYPHAAHTLEFDDARDRYHSDLIQWAQQVFSGATVTNGGS